VFQSQSTAYLRFQQGAVVDTSGNRIAAITSANALQAGPAIYQWDMDMNTGVVTIYFTDAVADGFRSFGLGVQNAVAGPTYSTVLGTQALFNQSDSTQIIFQVVLDNSDLSAIKFGGMGGDTRGTFLTAPFGLTAGIAQDTFVPELRSVETKNTMALQLTRLIKDITPPRLLYFSLNVGTSILLLTFNEPVVAASLVTTDVTLLSPITGKVYMYIHLCMYIYIYVYVYTCILTYVYIHRYIYMYMYLYIYMYVYLYEIGDNI
jgi:hypothetical protein